MNKDRICLLRGNSPKVGLGISISTGEAQGSLIHNFKMTKDVIVMCYHYFIGNMDSKSNSLFMCPTCLNPCALMSEIGTCLLLH